MIIERLNLFFSGSTATQEGDTTMKAGSLLDDNQWHDVEIVRDGRQINFTVDRLTITNMTNGEFFQLDLDRYVSNWFWKKANLEYLIWPDKWFSAEGCFWPQYIVIYPIVSTISTLNK